MVSYKLPETFTALEIHLTRTEYNEITITNLRGIILILNTSNPLTFNEIMIEVSKKTGILPIKSRYRDQLTILETMGMIESVFARSLGKYQGEIYRKAEAKHRKYTSERTGRNREGDSKHDELRYYFITKQGAGLAEKIEKIFPNGIMYHSAEEK